MVAQHFRLEHQHEVMHLTDEQVEQPILELTVSLVSDEAGVNSTTETVVGSWIRRLQTAIGTWFCPYHTCEHGRICRYPYHRAPRGR
jgi:hypothetical protein